MPRKYRHEEEDSHYRQVNSNGQNLLEAQKMLLGFYQSSSASEKTNRGYSRGHDMWSFDKTPVNTESPTITGASHPDELYAEYRQSFIDDVLKKFITDHTPPSGVGLTTDWNNISYLRNEMIVYFSSKKLKPINGINPDLEAWGLSFAAAAEGETAGGESEEQQQLNTKEILGYDFQTGPNVIFRNHEGTFTVFPVDGSTTVPDQYQGTPTDRRINDVGQVTFKLTGPGALVYTVHLLVYYQVVYQT